MPKVAKLVHRSKLTGHFISFITIIVTTLLQSRVYLKGFYYGDPFDGRLAITIHEHWWHVFRGQRDLFDTYFFYPFSNSLGFSDAYLLQGFFYSIARAFNFDLVDSWAVSVIIVFLMTNIGLMLIAKKHIKNSFLQVSFVITTGSSFTYYAFLSMNTNVAGFGLIVFLVYFINLVFDRNESTRVRNLGLIGLSVAIPLLLMSAWYAIFFSFIFLFIYFLVYMFRISFNLKVLSTNIKCLSLSVKTSIKYSALTLFLLLTSLWVLIYLPVLNDVERSVEEVQAYSLKFNQLANGSAFGGGVFKYVYQSLGYFDTGNLVHDKIGLGITIFLAWFTTGTYLFYLALRKSHKMKFEFTIWICSTFLIIFFIQLDSTSLFQLTWELIPALKSVRISSRVLVLIAAIIIFLVHTIIDKKINEIRKFRFIKISFLLLIPFIIFLDQIRFEYVSWTKDQYTSKEYDSKAKKAQQICTAFLLDSESEEWWDDQLKAMEISARYNFPTVNGYSGGFPSDYPNQDWRSRTNLIEVIRWLAPRNALNETCLIRRNSVEILSEPIIFNSLSGFDLMEKSSKNIWWWSKNPVARFSVINASSEKITGLFLATLELPPCQARQSIRILNLKTRETIFLEVNEDSVKFKMKMNLPSQSDNVLEFEALESTCQLPNDSRALHFSLKNPRFQD